MRLKDMKQFAIDFEYFFDDDMEMVPLCVAISDGHKTHSWWLLDPKEKSNFIRTVLKYKETGVFIAHAIEPAEGRCFYALGLKPEEFNWRDTFVESVIVNNSNLLRRPENSLAAVSAKLIKKPVDTVRKEYCRNLIITRQYEGHEQEILDYCESDVADLLIIADKLRKTYARKYARSTPVLGKKQAREELLLEIGATSARFATIACRGIPLNDKYVNMLLDNAPACLANLQKEFNSSHHIYEVGAKKIVRKRALVQEKLQEFADSRGITWPTTPSGLLSTAEGVLKEWKNTGSFPDALRTHGKTCRALSSFCKSGEKNWLHNYKPKKQSISPSLFPYGTQTGRCAAKPRSGFIYTWGRVFRGIISPPEGYCLIEMDYGSQEVCISAEWSNDDAMLDSYLQNDYYLAFMQKCGQFPKDLPLPTEEERSLPQYAPYKPMRQLAKGCCLGLSYGMGVTKLAGAMDCEENVASEYKRNFEKVYRKYTRKRADLKDMVGGKFGATLSFSDGFMYEVFPSGRYETRTINSMLNLPIQGLGSVILRELVRLCFERGLYLIATIHDAVVIMCPEDQKEEYAMKLDRAMKDAARNILGTDNMKVGAPEYTFHDVPSTHGAEKEWDVLINMLEKTSKTAEIPDTSEIFDIP